MNDMKEYIQALKNGKGYSWIANNGHKLNKYELIDIIKELDYAINFMSDFDRDDIFAQAAAELSNIYEEE